MTKLAKQIGGVLDLRVPASLDMGFVGLARGGLFVGFSAGQATAIGIEPRLLDNLTKDAAAALVKAIAAWRQTSKPNGADGEVVATAENQPDIADK